MANKKFITDYVSGKKIGGTPEEVNSVQPMIKKLIDVYGYSKNVIQSHPQFRIPKNPSDERNTYPLDIAVFETKKKTKENLRLIVECKAPNKKSGRGQLEKYLSLCDAKIGVWFNANDTLTLLKEIKNKKFNFVEIGDIPSSDMDIENFNAVLYKKDLKKNGDFVEILSDIKKYLITSGDTDSADVAKQMVHLILCKIYDEKNTDTDKQLQFFSGIKENPDKVAERINNLFCKVKKQWRDIFKEAEQITLPENLLKVCVIKLQRYEFLNASRDVIGDAFETFIGETLRSEKGQYFTPRNVTRTIINCLDPNIDDTILDPASGSGGFLISSLHHLWSKTEKIGERKGWTQVQIGEDKIRIASNNLFGFEQDAFLTKVSKAYMAIMGDGSAGIFKQDSLVANADYIRVEEFDCIFTNPPYGKKIKIEDKNILKLYELAKKNNGKLKNSVAPEILFIEKIISLLKKGGVAGIVLPEALFTNKNDKYIIKYILSKTKIEGVISLPAETFKSSGADKKACIVFLRKGDYKNYNIFMAKCNKIGIDKRAKPIREDDLPLIEEQWKIFKNNNNNIPEKQQNQYGSVVSLDQIDDYIFTPHTYFYKKQTAKTIASLGKTISLKELEDKKIISIITGTAVKSTDYNSSGRIPFVRTSNIHNLEVSYRAGKYITEQKYNALRNKYDIKEKDILFVIRGRTNTEVSEGLIGKVALIQKGREKIAMQGGLVRIRIIDSKNEYNLTPELFAFLLNEDHVKEQIKSLAGIENGLTGINKERLKKIVVRKMKPSKIEEKNKKAIALFKKKQEIYDIFTSMNL